MHTIDSTVLSIKIYITMIVLSFFFYDVSNRARDCRSWRPSSFSETHIIIFRNSHFIFVHSESCRIRCIAYIVQIIYVGTVLCYRNLYRTGNQKSLRLSVVVNYWRCTFENTNIFSSHIPFTYRPFCLQLFLMTISSL